MAACARSPEFRSIVERVRPPPMRATVVATTARRLFFFQAARSRRRAARPCGARGPPSPAPSKSSDGSFTGAPSRPAPSAAPPCGRASRGRPSCHVSDSVRSHDGTAVAASSADAAAGRADTVRPPPVTGAMSGA
ncbi:hypothetical protein FPZ41_19050 [Streptomyces sp. K1PN6]|uniref:Uncharacterized protein n=1 Tax=Streptomyces acidicola TaxID=2596892 RepID=A0A5N8WTG3_9ACTN|nr:hypothetical protein [Streptomyces acidicola]